MKVFYSIKAKLFLVFLIAATIFVGGGGLTIYFITQIGNSAESFISSSLPQLSTISKLEITAQNIAVNTYRLTGAKDKSELDLAFQEVMKLLDTLEKQTSTISQEGGAVNVLILNSLSQSIRSLSQIVVQILSHSYAAKVQLNNNLLSSLELLNKVRSEIPRKKEENYQSSISYLTTVMALSLVKAQNSESIEQVNTLKDNYVEDSRHLVKLFGDILTVTDSSTVSQELKLWLKSSPSSKTSFFEQRHQLLSRQKVIKNYLIELDDLALQLNNLTGKHSTTVLSNVRNKADKVIAQEKHAIRITLFMITFAAVLLLTLHWLIVIKGFGSRLTVISRAMRSIPKSVKDTKIAVQGRDEIATMARALEQLLEKALQTRKMATIDDLTQINNRRSFFTFAETETQRSKRRSSETAIVMFDIDHFKQVNDQYGHDAGDKILIAISNIGRKCIRNADIFARLGGDEFVILLPETNLVSGMRLASRLREKIVNKSHPINSGLQLEITMSIGITAVRLDETDIENAMIQADKALYQAKTAGRDRIACYQDEDIVQNCSQIKQLK